MEVDFNTETIDHCIVCHSNDCAVDPEFERLLGLVEPYHVQRCKSCGMRWLSPRPDESGYEQLYKFETYFVFCDYATLANDRRYPFRKRIEKIEEYYNKQRLDILDVGAATGEFLNEALLRGHVTTGIEISKGARDIAYKQFKLDFIDTPLHQLPKGLLFDVIHMNHVLEHMPDPSAILSECYRRLNPGGLLVIEIPQQFYNDLDRLKKLLGLAKKPEFDPYSLHHTFFFDPKTIRLLINNAGFQICRLQTANIARTPLWPLKLSNLVLAPYLFLSDKIHAGGNIIEVYAQKPI